MEENRVATKILAFVDRFGMSVVAPDILFRHKQPMVTGGGRTSRG